MEWTMPAQNTKCGKQHRVPLSEAALRILEETHALALALGLSDGITGLVFPSPTGKIMGSGSLLKLLHENGFHDATVHGIRSTFTDWAEKRGVRRRVSNAALAHVRDHPYRRTRFYDDRVDLMQDWAEHLGSRTPRHLTPDRNSHNKIRRFPQPPTSAQSIAPDPKLSRHNPIHQLRDSPMTIQPNRQENIAKVVTQQDTPGRYPCSCGADGT